MRHRRRTKYFGVKTAHRKAMFRNMVTSLFEHGRIKTTVTRAKELRRLADKMVTLAKDGRLHARRQALSVIMDKGVVARLFEEIAPKMNDRQGGYTRIVRIGPRRGDGAMMCYIELVTEPLDEKKGPEKEVVGGGAAAEELKAPTVIPEAKEDVAPDSDSAPASESASVESETVLQQEDNKDEIESEDNEDLVSESEGEAPGESEAKDEADAGEDEDSEEGKDEK